MPGENRNLPLVNHRGNRIGKPAAWGFSIAGPRRRQTVRRVVGLLIIAALAWAAVSAARPPSQELVEPPQGSGGSCYEWREVDPEGNLGPPVTTVTLRNGQGKIFLRVLCGASAWDPQQLRNGEAAPRSTR